MDKRASSYSENDLKAIESLMVFADFPQGAELRPGRPFAITYAKADQDQFADLIKFDAPVRQTELRPAEQPACPARYPNEGNAGELQMSYAKSDLSLFERIALPLLETDFVSESTARTREPDTASFYTAQDVEAFSQLTQFQREERDPHALSGRERPERLAMKIIDTDKERANERQNYWSRQASFKIVFSEAEGSGKRTLP